MPLSYTRTAISRLVYLRPLPLTAPRALEREAPSPSGSRLDWLVLLAGTATIAACTGSNDAASTNETTAAPTNETTAAPTNDPSTMADTTDVAPPASSPSNTAPPPTPAHERLDCDLPLAMSYCGGSTCHYDTVAQELGSSLALWHRETETLLEGVEAQLVNVPASYQNVTNPDDCPTEPELLVNTSDVEQSLMLKKLLGTHACGAEMPRFPYQEWGTVSTPGPEREDHVACIRQWITLLAADHGGAQ